MHSIKTRYIPCVNILPGGVLPNKEVRGTCTSQQVWRQTLRQGQATFTKQEEKLGKFCHHKTQKLGKNPHSGVISEIHMVKFGVIVINIFGGKIWDFNKNFRGNFGGQAPHLLIWKYPWGYSQCGCVNLNSKSKPV